MWNCLNTLYIWANNCHDLTLLKYLYGRKGREWVAYLQLRSTVAVLHRWEFLKSWRRWLPREHPVCRPTMCGITSDWLAVTQKQSTPHPVTKFHFQGKIMEKEKLCYVLELQICRLYIHANNRRLVKHWSKFLVLKIWVWSVIGIFF